MPGGDFIELLRLGPFNGVDYTSSDLTVQAGNAVAAYNANISRKTGALMSERGRQEIFAFESFLDDVGIVYAVVGRNNQNFFLIQGHKTGAGVVTFLFDSDGNPELTIKNALPFTQCVQFGEVIYTNAGQRLFLNPLSPTFYDWQYPAPTSPPSAVVLTSGTGAVPTGTYYYVITHRTTMPDKSVSETSVDLAWFENPPNIVLSAAGSIILTPHGGFTWTGTNDDGTTYSTNLYRQSSNQAGYSLVANIYTEGPYTDNASDIALLSNQGLEVSRDPPPLSASNQGWLCIHNGSIWIFLIKDVLADPSGTTYVPQVQLWYSHFDRVWEFDATAQVLLCQSDVTSAPGPPYAALYGNPPMGLVEVGTLLLALTRRQTWGVYGSSQADYFQRQLFNIGCVAPYSILGVAGGAYWLSDSGVYSFSGSSPQGHPEHFTDLLRGVPGWPASPGLLGVSPSDQVQACGSYYNFTYYLHFPTLQKSYGYHTPTTQWLGELPYAPRYPQSVCTVQANPTSDGAQTWNMVVAARAGNNAGTADYYFADDTYDLNNAQTCTWVGPTTYAPDEAGQKVYRFLTLTGPFPMYGSAVVTLDVDPGCYPPKQCVWTIPDLSDPALQARPIKTVGSGSGGALWGFMAKLTVALTGAPLNVPEDETPPMVPSPPPPPAKPGPPEPPPTPARPGPPQLWSVVCWGSSPPDRRLVART